MQPLYSSPLTSSFPVSALFSFLLDAAYFSDHPLFTSMVKEGSSTQNHGRWLRTCHLTLDRWGWWQFITYTLPWGNGWLWDWEMKWTGGLWGIYGTRKQGSAPTMTAVNNKVMGKWQKSQLKGLPMSKTGTVWATK